MQYWKYLAITDSDTLRRMIFTPGKMSQLQFMHSMLAIGSFPLHLFSTQKVVQ